MDITAHAYRYEGMT